MRSRSLLVLLAALIGPVAPVSAGPEVAGTATLTVSPSTARHGATLTLTGALATDEACAAGRSGVIELLPATSPTWETVATLQTGAGGDFAVRVPASQRGNARAVIAAEEREGVSCGEVVSPTAPVEVRAAVAATLDRPRLGAGGCARLSISVRPPKPGQEVVVQRRAGDGWSPLATLQLDDASAAFLDRCHGWSAIGRTYELRAVWEAQDDAHLRGASPAVRLRVVKASWMRRIDRLVGGAAMSVSVREEGSFLYRRRDTASRIPASNQKLLMSMSLLSRLPADATFPTAAGAVSVTGGGVVEGNLWLVGSGDPTMGRAAVDRLARRIVDAGITRIRGGVRGATTPFGRDWFAPGWKRSFPSREIALPTALVFERNRAGSRHVSDPERRAARRLTRRLRDLGVPVAKRPGMGTPPSGLTQVARVRSGSLEALLTAVNTSSWNFGAEVLGKRLGLERSGAPGTIARGAAATRAWASARGVGIVSHDASGLSYDNRVTAAGVARLLGDAEGRPWGRALRRTLASPGRGTLGSRLSGTRVRAKTGTLSGVSALSGWVWLEKRGVWGEFSILSRGLSKARAVELEDAIVRILSSRGR